MGRASLPPRCGSGRIPVNQPPAFTTGTTNVASGIKRTSPFGVIPRFGPNLWTSSPFKRHCWPTRMRLKVTGRTLFGLVLVIIENFSVVGGVENAPLPRCGSGGEGGKPAPAPHDLRHSYPNPKTANPPSPATPSNRRGTERDPHA